MSEVYFITVGGKVVEVSLPALLEALDAAQNGQSFSRSVSLADGALATLSYQRTEPAPRGVGSYGT